MTKVESSAESMPREIHQMYSESKRVEYLDSIRGLAALFVLLAHTIGAFDWPATYGRVCGWPFVSILFNGKEAVCMFFVLSGFVLSKPYAGATKSGGPRRMFLPTFYLRRFTRIWLPWFFVFVLSLVARKFWFSQPLTDPPVSKWLGQFWRAPLTAGDFFRQCAFLLHDNSRQLLNQDWSLGVELKGSLLIPLFLFLLPGKRLPALLALAVALSVFGRSGHCYVSFIIGVSLAGHGEPIVGWLRRAGRLARVLWLVFGLSLYQSLSLLLTHFPETRTLYKCGWIATSLGCALVLLAAFSSQSVQKLLSRKPLVFLGRVSYSVYLLQFIIILCCLPPLVRLANGCGLVNRPALFALVLLASVGATVGCSAITYRFVEQPAINLGHRLTRKIQLRFQTRPQP